MRYRLLGDLLNIKSALLYKRGYVDVVKMRHPSYQMNSVKTNQSDHAAFMEYDFKFKLDKGYYSSFNISNFISSQTMSSLLGDSNNLSDIPSNLLMYQISNNDTNRNYSLFEIFNPGDSTEMILDLGVNIQKIEFYDRFLNYEFNEDGEISDVEEYNINNPNPLSEVPILIVEFGPEESYEPEDYYNKEEMPIKPDWDEESERKYLMEIEEYSNKKFLTISTTSSDSGYLNLSLSSHKSQIDPHRNQEKYVIENKDFKSMMNSVGKTIESYDDTSIVLDKRSNTILGNSILDSSSLILLNDKINLSSKKIPVTSKDENEGIITRYYEEYKDYVVYHENDSVYYKGDVFISLINGNLSENPSISPMWALMSKIEDPELPEGFGDPHVVNIRVNDSKLGTTDPIGPTNVEYGHELYVKIITDKALVRSIKLDGVSQTIPMGKVFTVSNVIDDHDLLIEFEAIYKNLKLISDPIEGGTTKGSGRYVLNTSVEISAVANYGYEFSGWYINEKILSTSSTYIIEKLSDDMVVTAKFSIRKYNVVIECSEGGTYTPMSSNPTRMQVDHGSSLTIGIVPYTGYETEYIKVNDRIYEYYDKPELIINNITEDYSIYIKYSRPQYHVIDPILGRINYVVIGDQLWSTSNLNYPVRDTIQYYSGEEMKLIDEKLGNGGTKFRVPTEDDINELYSYFDEKKVGLYLKSDKITRFDDNGWKDSIFRGLNYYRFNSMPYGYYNGKDLVKKNKESHYWTSTINKETDSATTMVFYHDSPMGVLEDKKLSDNSLCIKPCADAYKVNILGKDYRYLEVSIKVNVRILDDDNVSSNDKFETHVVTQKWILDNLDYTDLGTRFEESECGKFGSLYSLDEVSKISELMKSDKSGFSIPTDLDYIFLEKFLGYGKDQIVKTKEGRYEVDLDTYSSGYIGSIEGKRLKTGNLIYSGVNWNGYDNNEYDNSQLNVLPSGYAVVLDDGSLEYKGMGSEAKFWTSSISRTEDKITAYSRSLSCLSDKILRGVDGSKIKMSIRMVSTNIN